MPTGLSKIRQLNEESAARKAAYEAGGSGIRYVTLKDKEQAKVRFLEQGEDVFFLYVHRLPKKPGQKFGDRTPCLDQDNTGQACPACERGESRSYVIVLNVIWFDAPKFVRDAQGKVVRDDFKRPIVNGTENTIAVWVRGPTEGDRITYLDTQYNGLSNWIFKIRREGSGKDDTKYHVDPWDPTAGPTTPTPEEREIAAKKHDPRTVERPMSYADMARAYSGGAPPPAPGSQPPADAPAQPNAFEQAQTGGSINKGAFS